MYGAHRSPRLHQHYFRNHHHRADSGAARGPDVEVALLRLLRETWTAGVAKSEALNDALAAIRRWVLRRLPGLFRPARISRSRDRSTAKPGKIGTPVSRRIPV